MSKDLAVVDSSAIILLGVPPPPEAPENVLRRIERARERMQELKEEGCRFVVPAPVLAELGRDGPGHVLAQALFTAIGGMRIECFDAKCAEVTSRMLAPALKARAPGESRVAMKYDAMIAATAHALDAGCLVTENPRDFARYFAIVSSSVELVIASEVRRKGQLRFLDRPSNT